MNAITLSSFDRAVILAATARFPEGVARVVEQLLAKGVEPEVFLNAPESSPEVERIGRDRFARLHPDPPPGWELPPGVFYQARAFHEVVRRARADGLNSLLIVEDDCDLTADFDRVVAAAEVPEDWQLLYYGAYHNWSPTEEIGPHLLRLRGSVGMHCLGIRASAFDAILGLPPDGPMDQMIADRLHPAVPTYALWPSVAIQRHELSAITGEMGGWPTLFETKGTNWPAVG